MVSNLENVCKSVFNFVTGDIKLMSKIISKRTINSNIAHIFGEPKPNEVNYNFNKANHKPVHPIQKAPKVK